MANGKSYLDILAERAQLDQAPEESLQEKPQEVKESLSPLVRAYRGIVEDEAETKKPQEKPKKTNPLVDVYERTGAAPEVYLPTRPGFESFGRGFTETGRAPLTLPLAEFGIDPNADLAQPQQEIPLKEHGLGYLGGSLLGFGTALVPISAGISVGLGSTGLLAALGPTISRVTVGALSFGTYEALSQPEEEKVPEEFAKGAAIGAAFEVGLLGLKGLLKARSRSQLVNWERPGYIGPERQLPLGREGLLRGEGGAPAGPRGLPGRGEGYDYWYEDLGPFTDDVVGAADTPAGLIPSSVVRRNPEPIITPPPPRPAPTVEGKVLGEVRVSPRLYEDLAQRALDARPEAKGSSLAWFRVLERARKTSKGYVVPVSKKALEGAILDLENTLQILADTSEIPSNRALIAPARRLLAALRGMQPVKPVKTGAAQGELFKTTGSPQPFDDAKKAVDELAERQPWSYRQPSPLGYIPNIPRLDKIIHLADGRRIGKIDSGNHPGVELTPGGAIKSPDPVWLSEAEELGAYVETPRGRYEYRFVTQQDGKWVTQFKKTELPVYLPYPEEGVNKPFRYTFHTSEITDDFDTQKRLVSAIRSGISEHRLPDDMLARIELEGTPGSGVKHIEFSVDDARILRNYFAGMKARAVEELVKSDHFSDPPTVVREIDLANKALAIFAPGKPSLNDIVKDLQLTRVDRPDRLLPPKSSATSISSEFAHDAPAEQAGGVVKNKIIIDSDAYALEKLLAPTSDSTALRLQLSQVVRALDSQLEIAVAKLGDALRPGSEVIIPLTTSPGRILAEIKRQLPHLRSAVRKDGNKRWRILLADSEVRGPRAFEHEVVTREQRAVIDAATGEGQYPEFADVVELLQMEVDDPFAIRGPDFWEIGERQTWELGGLFGGAYGEYGLSQPSGYSPSLMELPPGFQHTTALRLAKMKGNGKRVTTAIHEYMHHVFASVMTRQGERIAAANAAHGLSSTLPQGSPDYGTFEGVFFDVWQSAADPTAFHEVFGTSIVVASKSSAGVPVDIPFGDMTPGQFWDLSEVQRLTFLAESANDLIDNDIVPKPGELVQRLGLGPAGSPATSYDKFYATRSHIDGNLHYYMGSDTELAARAGEVFSFDMKSALYVAPNATKMLLALIADHAPQLKLVLQGKRLAGMNELLKGKAVTYLTKVMREPKFGRHTVRVGEKELKQFSDFGFYEGQSIYLYGQPLIIEEVGSKGIFAREAWTEPGERTFKLTSTYGIDDSQVVGRAVKEDLKELSDWLLGRRSTQPKAWEPVPGSSFLPDVRPLRSIPLNLQVGNGVISTMKDYGMTAAKIKVVDGEVGLKKELVDINPEMADVVATMTLDDIINAVLKREYDNDLLIDFGTHFRLVTNKPVGAGLGSVTGRLRPLGYYTNTSGSLNGRVFDITYEDMLKHFFKQSNMQMRLGIGERDIEAYVDGLVDQAGIDIMRLVDNSVIVAQNKAKSAEAAIKEQAAKLAAELPDDFLSGLIDLFGNKPSKGSIEGRLFDTYNHKTRLDDMASRVNARVHDTTSGKKRVEVDPDDAPRDAGVFIEAEDVAEYLRRMNGRHERFRGFGEQARETNTKDAYGSSERMGESGFGFDADKTPPGSGGHSGGGSKGPPGGKTGPGLGGAGKSRGPNPNETFGTDTPEPLGWFDRIIDATSLFAPLITGMETVSKAIERHFKTGAYTRIFQPLQEAVRTVDREMKVKRPGLKGRSYYDQLKEIEKLSWQLRERVQREQVVRWLEAMSKEEIARAGGLLQRGMNSFEIAFANEISRLGLADKMPSLISTWRLMKNLEGSRKAFMKQYNKLVLTDLSPVMRERLAKLYTFARNDKEFTFEKMAEVLNLNPAEARVIQMLDAVMGDKRIGPDLFSIFAVTRYAAADHLPRGFKTMRDWYAATNKMNATQLKLGRELETLFAETFKQSGINPKRYLGGYYPHMRQYIREGIFPDSPLFKKGNMFPKESNFTAMKFRSGELDPYTMEPLKVAVKHVRGMLMHQHFDPKLKDVRAALRELYVKDQRSFRIMREYVNELQGKPHESFDKVQKAIETAAKVMGYEVDKEMSRRIVNSLAALTYQSTIPFRAGLIARNYFQMVQTVVPRVGWQDFMAGLQRALTKEGFAEARAANAVTENVAPIISQESIFGFDTFKLSRRMQRLTEVGFRWYQSADDLGRATAFHAQKIRMGRAIDNYMRGTYGKDKIEAIYKMMAEGKGFTFDPVDQKQFLELFKQGKYEAGKNYLGEMLARETIFRYGHANHPAGWGSVSGRLFGQFGTWPVQYKDYLLQGLSRGTLKDKAEFALWHSAINAGIISAGASAGYDLWSWVSFPSLTYTGGPYANAAIDLVKLVGGSDREQALAWQSLKFQFVPTLNDPRAVWLPGSYAIHDLAKLWSEGSGIDEAMGFRRYQSGDSWVLDSLTWD